MLWCWFAVWHHTLQRWQRLLAVFSPLLCESDVTIRTQLWQATCPRAYVVFSVFKQPMGSSVAFLENFCTIPATFVASGSCKSSTFYWCLFWELEAAGKAGRQLESCKNGPAKLFFFFFLNSRFFQFSVRAQSVSSSHAEAGIATGPSHMSVLVANEIRAHVQRYQMPFSLAAISLSLS